MVSVGRSKFITATPEERLAWIDEYVARNLPRWVEEGKRIPRYNGKGKGRAPKGTVSPASGVRRRAISKWASRRQRALELENG